MSNFAKLPELRRGKNRSLGVSRFYRTEHLIHSQQRRTPLFFVARS
jgi:hypothetical protein